MMQRTQITLDPTDHRRARRRASDLGISLSEYIRRLVRDDLTSPATPQDPTGLFGLGDSGGSNVSRAKDAYVGEAVAAARRRR